MTPEKKCEVVILIVSLMGLGFVGTVLNNAVVVSIKESLKLQRYANNILLGNLCFCNLVVSTLVLNTSAIYVSYALAISSTDVDIVFCDVYTFVYEMTLTIFPFTLFVWSWHVFLSGTSLIRGTSFVAVTWALAVIYSLVRFIQTRVPGYQDAA